MNFLQLSRPLRSKEVRELQEFLHEYYGATIDTDCAWFIHEKDNDVYLVTRDLERLPYTSLRINNMGMYIGQRSEKGNGLRLGIEGAQLLGKAATKHVLEIPDEFTKWYLYGDDIVFGEVTIADGWYIIRNSKDVLGCSLMKGGTLLNFTPKGRRISSKE